MHIEVGDDALFALFHKARKFWCAPTTASGSPIFERCCHSTGGFVEIIERDPRYHQARYLQFTIQRPIELGYIPHLLVHALDTGLPTILSRWDAATTKNQQINVETLDRYAFVVRRGKCREIFRTKGLSTLREWVFSHWTGPQESKEKLQKDWIYWEQHYLSLLLSWHLQEEVPRKVKCNCVPLAQSSKFRGTQKRAINPAPFT